MGFCSDQLDRLQPLWSRITGHPFLVKTRDGDIDRDVFANWMRQDYLFVEAAIPFVSAILARSPREHWEPLTRVVTALLRELGMFEERAAAVGVELRGAEPGFVNHAYIQFLVATGHAASFAEAWTVLYVAEKAYYDSWRTVREGIDPESPWLPFVENWSGPDFAEYVTYLEGQLDALAADCGEAECARMAHLFEITGRYELAFWDMAYHGAAWPGLPEWSAADQAATGGEGG